MSAGEKPKIEPRSLTQEQADAFYHHFRPEIAVITGGEPLLKFDVVKMIARSAAAYGGAVALLTNGSLITDRIIEEYNGLNEKAFYQISLDGTEQYHDYLRQRTGAFQEAVRAIDLCSATRLTKVRMTVTSDNFSQIPFIIQLLDQFGRNNIVLVMRPVRYTGRAIDNWPILSNGIIGDLDQFGDLSRFICVEKVNTPDKCGMGIDTIIVEPQGDIYPCYHVLYKPDYKMGNFFDDYLNLSVRMDFANYQGRCYVKEVLGFGLPPKG